MNKYKIKSIVGYSRNNKRYGISIGKDKYGFFAYTHRARSKSYKTKDLIPEKDLEFIDSTG